MSEVAFLLDANMPRSAVDVFRARRLVVTDVRDLGGALATATPSWTPPRSAG